ncbi:MAG TPA: GAF domain-containing protein [Devosiaceae bacterium]|jgi:hypothetical protein
MTDTAIAKALTAFDAAIAAGTEAEAPWRALEAFAQVAVGAKLFTIMRIEGDSEVSARVYSSNPGSYPVSGTKPIERTYWFETLHTRRTPFVANTIGELAKVFPDHELIWSLGCGSVINWPVIIGDAWVGTVNLLHEEHYYTPERVKAAGALSLPAKTAFLAATFLGKKPGPGRI